MLTIVIISKPDHHNRKKASKAHKTDIHKVTYKYSNYQQSKMSTHGLGHTFSNGINNISNVRHGCYPFKV